MAIKVSNTEVVSNTRELKNISAVDDGTVSVLNTALSQVLSTDPTRGTLTKSFASGEVSSISLSSALSPAPVVSVIKEIPQVGIVSKGAWDVATSGANYDRLDSAYDTTLTQTLEGWDISTASFLHSFSVAAQESNPQGVFFKPDGSKMYIIGLQGDDVNEYNLSTAWDVSTASYVQNFSVSAQEAYPEGLFFKPDGTKMYIIGFSGDDVNEYNLSTAWDVSTAVYSQAFYIGAQEGGPQGVFFKPDGLKMYITGTSGQDVNEYNLSTAWDISTASFLQNFSVSGQETAPRSVFFKPDGTKMYITGTNQRFLNEYNLSTAWNISTSVYNQNFNVSTRESAPQGVFFKPDGLKMYIVGTSGDDVNEYGLDVSGNIFALGSGSFASTDVGKTIEGNGGVAALTATDGSYNEVTAFDDDSTIAAGDWAMYGAVFDATNGLEMSFTAINTWDVSASVYSQNFSVAAQDSTPSDVFFKPDGTKMYIVGLAGRDVNEYNLSTAWDISTASYSQNFSVAAQEAYPYGIFLKPDGTKMYIVGTNGDEVNEYNLSTAWDISTSVYSQNFSVISQETYPLGISFKPDGTKMYIVGGSGQDVNEYNLSTAWDISTSSYSQNFYVGGHEISPNGVSFRPDGTKMYIVGTSGDDVNEYNLSTAWDISTSVYSQNFYVGSQEATPHGIFFKPDGTKMYIVGASGDDVNEYDIGSFVSATGYAPSITNAGGQINSAFWLDINGMTTDEAAGDGNVYYAVSTDDRTTWSVINEADGVRPIVRNNAGTWQYNNVYYYPDQIWLNATTNSELYALQQALAGMPANRMDKAQLEAVTDPNHYTLGDSLDLMIGLYLGSASTSVPSSDGVSINYDAESLNKGAILGTDYDYDFPDSTTVRITSNATQNLKVRVV